MIDETCLHTSQHIAMNKLTLAHAFEKTSHVKYRLAKRVKRVIA